MVANFIFDLIHKVLDLVLVKDLVIERNLTKDFNGVSVSGHQRRVLRATDDEMHLDIFCRTDLHC